jgi:uncharacterized membrane protein
VTSSRHDEHRARDALSQKMWLIPTVFVLVAVVLAQFMLWIDDLVPDARGPLLFRGPVTGGQQILTIIATSMLGLMGVVFSISIVALQLASTQFSPRVLRTFLRDRRNQYVLGQFAATFVYAIVVLGSFQVDEDGDSIYTSLSVTVGFLLVLGSLAAFIYFIHHISRSLRVVHIIEAVAEETRGAIDYSYPPEPDERVSVREALVGEPIAVLTFEHHSGVVAALDLADLAELAARHDAVLRFLPEVGEYVSRTAPFCEVYGKAVPPLAEVLAHLDIAPERTMYQDVAFGFRQLVDIAEKALSPAINDPTTCVQVIDRLEDFLLQLSNRPIPTGVVCDASGTPRLVHEVVGWTAFVGLAFDEIRDYGCGSLQVVRRLRAAVDRLERLVPAARRPPLVRQRVLLQRAVEKHFDDPDERLLASTADGVGVGGDEE